MTSKVLVPIDNTGLSQLVVDALAAQTNPDQAEVLVLEIVEPLVRSTPPQMAPGYAPEMAPRQEQNFGRAKQILNEAVELFHKAGFKASSRVVESEIKEGILKVASSWGASLIAVTSHERKGVAKFLHRSVAQAVVHSAPCSVLVVKAPAKKIAA